jgi:hypothetical protein
VTHASIRKSLLRTSVLAWLDRYGRDAVGQGDGLRGALAQMRSGDVQHGYAEVFSRRPWCAAAGQVGRPWRDMRPRRGRERPRCWSDQTRQQERSLGPAPLRRTPTPPRRSGTSCGHDGCGRQMSCQASSAGAKGAWVKCHPDRRHRLRLRATVQRGPRRDGLGTGRHPRMMLLCLGKPW